ncbi:histidine kinase [Desulfofundulus thermobenzoicus]|uniref:histidine kinase n=1 Tax=Desulfofundulus thermobenzoicus TaxID=29376 RepID=A0A6N7IUS9_9FIRM|nr:PocR ligand-binding domain-containing protein [Desulfofundulus thermobenzoicus]MQL53303.1 histidine kinase [Desulfofundulus thermobenzoicus]
MVESIYGLPVHGYLREIIEVSIMQELVDKFARATSVAAIVVDVDGSPVTIPSNFSEFCQMVRSSPVGEKGCYESDRRGGEAAARWNSLSLYQCHCTLIDMAAPLIVDGVYWGAVLCGQVLLEPPSQEQLQQIRSLAHRFGLDEEKLCNALKKIEVVTEKKIRAAGELLQIVANYIVEMSVSRITSQRLTQQLKEKADMERVMHQLELRALQSQVNPHFLFNTLNAACRLAMIEGASQTEELIHALSRLLRHTLRKIDQIVPLREELDYISNYLFIQKTRYGDHIDVQIQAQPEALDAVIPIMTLQPLVENAIVHGLEPKEDGGTIFITVQCYGEKVCIEVRDTGLGMEPGVVCHVLEGNRSGQGHTTGLGLSNVYQRLRHCFGEDCGLEIFGSPGEGTTVKVLIPARHK